MKKLFILVVMILSVVLVLGGCANKGLSKEEAKSILSKYPAGKLLRTISRNTPIKTIDPNDKAILEKLQAAGYLTLKEVSGKAAKGAEPRYEIAAMSRLSPFIVNEDADNINIKLADIVIDQVTAVEIKGEEADATYMTKLELTAVAEIYAPVSNPSPGPNHASLRLVDGKWK